MIKHFDQNDELTIVQKIKIWKRIINVEPVKLTEAERQYFKKIKETDSAVKKEIQTRITFRTDWSAKEFRERLKLKNDTRKEQKNVHFAFKKDNRNS